MKKDKKKTLKLLKQKKSGESKYTYDTISQQTGYSKRQLIRLSQLQEKGGTESMLTHGLTNKQSNNSASRQEIEYIKKFKEKYPNISIQQFMDIFHEDIVFNPQKHEDVKKYG